MQEEKKGGKRQKGMEMQKRQKELYKKDWTNISNKNKTLEISSMCLPLFNPYTPMHKFFACYPYFSLGGGRARSTVCKHIVLEFDFYQNGIRQFLAKKKSDLFSEPRFGPLKFNI